MSAPPPASTEKKEDVAGPSNGAKVDEAGEKKKKLPQLGALEDDDEFEVGSSSFLSL